MERSALASRLAVVQGTYWVASGIWPIVHLTSFEAVTGPKQAGWLVKTVGALIAAVGTTLAVAGARRRVTGEIALLGAASAAALGGAGGWYAARGRIRRIYLADAALEALTVAGWGMALRRARADARPAASAGGWSAARVIPVERREAVPEP
ncbi:hypothetical protein [Anaeromyxobacter sp. Fw109-5]|uniref:hypothetical protein n=1 Tax=Anaeromyxobacter sp. (strain Fw109-5) TaxID=404589 RepID=UPI00030089EC|nr:hypothetical protein [Anaeromyxobacter sp. Fw109-5]